jgi:hypothetical protein
MEQIEDEQIREQVFALLEGWTWSTGKDSNVCWR